jgi:hypothetical protein
MALLGDEQERRRIAARQRTYARERFSNHRMWTQYHELYRQILPDSGEAAYTGSTAHPEAR